MGRCRRSPALTSFDHFTALVRDRVKRMEPVRLFLLSAARGEKSRKRILEEFYGA